MLQIHLFVDDLDAAGYATGMATFTLLPQLARASLAIHGELPELGMWIEERVGTQRRRFIVHRPTDDRAAIARSFEVFPSNGLGESIAWIWSSDDDAWLELVVSWKRAPTPGSLLRITSSVRRNEGSGDPSPDALSSLSLDHGSDRNGH